MAFQCFKIQLKKIKSATENCGEHNVTGIFLDVSGGLNYLHNNDDTTWFSLNENGEHCDVLRLLMEIMVVDPTSIIIQGFDWMVVI